MTLITTLYLARQQCTCWVCLMGFELDSRTQWGSISQIYNVLPAHGSIQFFVVFFNGKILSILFLPNKCKKKKAF